MIGTIQNKGSNLALENNINPPSRNTKNDLKIVSFGKINKIISNQTPHKVPTQAASTYVKVKRLVHEINVPSETEKNLEPIKKKTEPIYNALRDFEKSAFNYHNKYDTTQNNVLGKEQWKEFKSKRNDFLKNPETVNTTNNLQTQTEYKIIKKRVQSSELEKHLSGSPLSIKLDPLTGVFRDTKTGLFAQLIPIKDKENNDSGDFALCFGSTGSGKMGMMQTKVDIEQVLNKEKLPAAYEQAAELAKALIQATSFLGVEIKVTGQSMGGGLANYVGLKLGIESVCFNPAALGQAAIKDLEKNGCLTAKNLEKQNIIRQKRDIVSGDKNQKKISTLASILTLHTVTKPLHLGKIHEVNKEDMGTTDKPKRGFQSRHFTSAFDPLYKPQDK